MLCAYRKTTHTNFIVCGLTRPGLEHTIYHTRGEHANHYNISMRLCGVDKLGLCYMLEPYWLFSIGGFSSDYLASNTKEARRKHLSKNILQMA